MSIFTLLPDCLCLYGLFDSNAAALTVLTFTVCGSLYAIMCYMFVCTCICASWNYYYKPHIRDATPSIDAYLLEKRQSCEISSRSDLKRRSLKLFKIASPTTTTTTTTRLVWIWDQFLIQKLVSTLCFIRTSSRTDVAAERSWFKPTRLSRVFPHYVSKFECSTI